jgi:hypothetical protein
MELIIDGEAPSRLRLRMQAGATWWEPLEEDLQRMPVGQVLLVDLGGGVRVTVVKAIAQSGREYWRMYGRGLPLEWLHGFSVTGDLEPSATTRGGRQARARKALARRAAA